MGYKVIKMKEMIRKGYIGITIPYLLFLFYPMIFVLTDSINRKAFLWTIGISTILTITNIILIKKEKEYIKEIIIGSIVIGLYMLINIIISMNIESNIYKWIVLTIVNTTIVVGILKYEIIRKKVLIGLVSLFVITIIGMIQIIEQMK